MAARDSAPGKTPQKAKSAKEARLAAALKRNLQRRKATKPKA